MRETPWGGYAVLAMVLGMIAMYAKLESWVGVQPARVMLAIGFVAAVTYALRHLLVALAILTWGILRLPWVALRWVFSIRIKNSRPSRPLDTPHIASPRPLQPDQVVRLNHPANDPW